MNREMIYTQIANFAESDKNYYNYEKHGIIEDMLALFDIPSESFIGSSSVIHTKNLEKLHDFIVNKATNEEITKLYLYIKEHEFNLK